MSVEATEELVEERAANEASLAEAFAALSACQYVPEEVSASMPFEPGDVLFSGNAWLDNLILVQDWLRLPERLSPEDSADRNLLRLGAALSAASPAEVLDEMEGAVQLSIVGLSLLLERSERAVALMEAFVEEVETSLQTRASAAAASARWEDAWESVDTVEPNSGPIRAQATIWSITDFASRSRSGMLELSPSFQRSDVWPTKDGQMLIESILRGIPLPSVILLRPATGADAPYEVVDGKQRLTAILRFIGAHPKALAKVEEVSQLHPGLDLEKLFHENYPRFRRAWKNATGDTLTAAVEKQYYFPFPLRKAPEAEISADLSPLMGKYYHQIRENKIVVTGREIPVSEIFELSTDYKVPMIEYTEASPRQIHEVFSLYNKQGKNLNAEEIRNAVYHEVDLMRALAVAAGDSERMEAAAPFLEPVRGHVDAIIENLNDYRFGEARYRRTKVLSWLTSVMVTNTVGADGRPRLLSTSLHINGFLDRVQAPDPVDPLRSSTVICDLIMTVAAGIDAHAGADPWAPKFKNGGNGERWQELQLVASLLGVTLAAVVMGDSALDQLEVRQAEIRRLTASDWLRPRKTQTQNQWIYIAKVALGVLDLLNVEPEAVDVALNERFGQSCIAGLQAIRHLPMD